MNDQTNLPDELTLPDELLFWDDPLFTGAAIQLPFPAPFLWWVRGEADKNPGDGSGARYFGGWATDAIKADALQNPLPDRFIRETFFSPDGAQYEVLATRSMALALIATRYRWNEQKNVGQTQNLCLLAEFDQTNQSFVAYGPVVLTTKSTTSMAMTQRWQEWAQLTAAARRDVAPNIPWWYFYAAIGTFSEERKQEMVGQDQQSHVTPPQLYGADAGITPEQLKLRFVGENNAALMLDYRKQAQPWLDDWNVEKEEESTTTDNGDFSGSGEIFDPNPPQPPAQTFDDPPF